MDNTAHIANNPGATSSPTAYKVFIAEDSVFMQPRIVELAMQVEDVVICGIAEKSADVFHAVLATKPDAAIFDINLLDGNSLPSLKQAKLAHPSMRVIVCSIFNGAAYRDAAHAAGADQFLDKSLECDRIPEILKRFKELSRAAQRPAVH